MTWHVQHKDSRRAASKMLRSIRVRCVFFAVCVSFALACCISSGAFVVMVCCPPVVPMAGHACVTWQVMHVSYSSSLVLLLNMYSTEGEVTCVDRILSCVDRILSCVDRVDRILSSAFLPLPLSVCTRRSVCLPALFSCPCLCPHHSFVLVLALCVSVSHREAKTSTHNTATTHKDSREIHQTPTVKTKTLIVTKTDAGKI